MAFTRLSPEAKFVTLGFGQVEPNHLSAQRTGEIYAQLPAAANIDILENGQFVKYDYANGVVNFGKDSSGSAISPIGEWMLVFNEVKVYRDHETDQDFAMIRRDYNGRVYSPVGVGAGAAQFGSSQAFPNGVGINGYQTSADWDMMKKIQAQVELYPDAHNNPAGQAPDYGRNHYAIGNSYEVERLNRPQMADYARPDLASGNGKAGLMVPRVFKTHEGDIFTTNTIADATVALGAELGPNNHGYLSVSGDKDSMIWQVVKIYNLGDMQKAVKVMRIK
jgi:hypothetical protein